MIELAFKKVVAIHPHWHSELDLSLFGGIVRHVLHDIIGSYIESGPVIIVEWPGLGKEEFIKIADFYYHISIVESLRVGNEKLYIINENLEHCTPSEHQSKQGTDVPKHGVCDSLDYNNALKIISEYHDLLNILLHSFVPEKNFHVCEDKFNLNLPLVSVIIPTKNRALLLREAIISVLSQTHRSIEVIIVDDGSTDHTKQIVDEFALDCNIKYIYAVCKRSTTARNVGLQHASGDYIAYLDDDNLWFSAFISSAILHLETYKKIDLVYGVLVLDDPLRNDGLFIFQEYNREKLKSFNYIDTNVIVHRSDLIKSQNLWDENLTRLGDWDFILSHTSQDNAAAIPVLAAYYRTHANDRNTVVYSLEENARYIQIKHSIIKIE